ncbi:MAG: cyclodeaminase/cyclohydrolase family protein [Actinomycetota bacterium]|nr:cyclodeaminase/cyclohydrolase family protein [Actinomycetota bacterium]
MSELFTRDLRSLLEAIADPSPAPGAGAVAGLVTAMAAGVIASAARRSKAWPEARGVSAQAQALRSRVEKLAEANEQAYLKALGLLEVTQPGGGRDNAGGSRDIAIGRALEAAANLPLAIAEAAYDVALLGAEAAEHAVPGCAEDGAAASLLAEAAARAAAGLVATNLVSSPGDDRVVHAQRLAAAATDAARRAVTAAATAT